MSTEAQAEAEEWRDAVGFEGYYEVSSFGRMRSVMRMDNRGRLWRPQILKVNKRPNGYLMVVLSRNGRRSTRAIHRLVAEAFIPNPERLPIVRHWDDDRTNNQLGNLLWGTDSDNKYDAVRNGINPYVIRDQCVNGHLFDVTNTQISPEGYRRCRRCDRERHQAARAVRSAARGAQQ